MSDTFTHLADIWVIVTIVVFVIILVPWVTETPQLVARRWMFLVGVLYLMRGLTVIDTRYPRLPFKGGKYQPTNPIEGAFMIMFGAKSTATDMVFSGHTINFILIASFVSRYTRYGILSHFVWIANTLGILALIAVREHYTTDIVVAVFLAKFVFWTYHLFFDSLYKRFWVSGITIEDVGDVALVLPAHIKDSIGQSIEIGKHLPSKLSIQHAKLVKNGQSVRVVEMNNIKSFRYQLWTVVKWLDNE